MSSDKLNVSDTSGGEAGVGIRGAYGPRAPRAPAGKCQAMAFALGEAFRVILLGSQTCDLLCRHTRLQVSCMYIEQRYMCPWRPYLYVNKVKLGRRELAQW